MKVMQLLQSHGFEPVRSREMQEAMLLIGAGLDSDDGLKALAKELGLSAIVTGEVGPKRAKIVVRDGGGGAILGDASFSAANPRKLADEVGLTFWKKLGADMERGHLPAGAKKMKKTSQEAAAEGDEGEEEGSESDEGAPAKKGKKRRRFKMEESPPEDGRRALRSAGSPWLDFELGVGGLEPQPDVQSERRHARLRNLAALQSGLRADRRREAGAVSLDGWKGRQFRGGGSNPAGARDLVDVGDRRELQRHRARVRRRPALPRPVREHRRCLLLSDASARTPSPSTAQPFEPGNPRHRLPLHPCRNRNACDDLRWDRHLVRRSATVMFPTMAGLRSRRASFRT